MPKAHVPGRILLLQQTLEATGSGSDKHYFGSRVWKVWFLAFGAIADSSESERHGGSMWGA